jgi:phosphohistidine swiveling domain-containing protein
MPDWNPSEIISPTPRRLALSLYQRLITDEVWATQRAEYGYRDVRPHPLMVTFGGHPYIDVRACFNSFIPASIPDALAVRLVNYYLDLLIDQPDLHDKVEFEVVFTCLDFNFNAASQRLLDHGFSEADVETLRRSLAEITQNALSKCQEELGQIAKLDERFQLTMAADLDPLARAFALIEDCKKYGTLPFAHLARTAFVANSLLRSLEQSGITSRQQTESFMRSIYTVSGSLERDGWQVAEGTLSWEEFQTRYAHLRPGTYEVTSPSYAENPERYLRPLVNTRPPNGSADNSEDVWNSETWVQIQKTLVSAGLSMSKEGFDGFLRQAIEGREYSKFVFSRHLSTALDELVRFGETQGLDRDQVSHVGIERLLAFYSGWPVDETGRLLAEQASEGKRWHNLALAIDLPPLLVESDDIFAHERISGQPNFVTTKRVAAEAIDLADGPVGDPDLEGFIVLIPQADPGFDWLFGHGIAGLITMYGGANSHMTIRAAEFGIPAAVGVGQALYEQLAGAKLIELDCAANWVRVLR